MCVHARIYIHRFIYIHNTYLCIFGFFQTKTIIILLYMLFCGCGTWHFVPYTIGWTLPEDGQGPPRFLMGDGPASGPLCQALRVEGTGPRPRRKGLGGTECPSTWDQVDLREEAPSAQLQPKTDLAAQRPSCGEAWAPPTPPLRWQMQVMPAALS